MFKFIGFIVTLICISYSAIDCLKVGAEAVEMHKNKIEQSINETAMSGMEKRQYYAHMRRDARDINGKIVRNRKNGNNEFNKKGWRWQSCCSLNCSSA